MQAISLSTQEEMKKMQENKVIGYGFNTAALPDGNFSALDAMLAEHVRFGCSHVEITALRNNMIVGGRINQRYIEKIKTYLERHKIDVTLHANHALNFMDLPNLEMHKAVAIASIEIANILGIRSIVIHSGRVPVDVWSASSKTLLEIERETLRMLADLAAQGGIRLSIENLTAKKGGSIKVYGADPRALIDQIELIDHPNVGGCLDFGHAFLSAPVIGFDFIDAVSEFSECAWHLHLHDNCGIPGERTDFDTGDSVAFGVGDLHLPIGWGRIPWQDILPRIRLRKGAHAMIELQGRYTDFEAETARTAKNFMDYWNGKCGLSDAISSSGFMP